jgi:putative membrane protein
MMLQPFRVSGLLLTISALFFGAAYLTARFPDMPSAWIGSFISTLLIALPSFVALWRFLGPKEATLSLLSLSAFGFAIELIGVTTGFPYGPFYYGESLGPKIAGLVPYLLPLSWAPLVLGAVAATAPEGETTSKRRIWWIFCATGLLVLLDGVLDPGAASLGFWVWPEGGPYYGVPAVNYLGWFFSSTLAVTLLLALGHRKWESAPPPPGLLDSTLIATSFWVGIAVFSGLLFPAMLGATLFFYLLRRRSRLAAVDRTRYKGGNDADERRLKA